MGKALLVEYYEELQHPGGGGRNREAREARLQAALDRFKDQVQARYTEGTLQRLLDAPGARTRRASVLALGLVGTMKSNAGVAAMLHDDDRTVRHLAADALWSLWFRAGSEANNRELKRLTQLSNPQKALTGLDGFVTKAPHFAELYNQRAIILYRLGDYPRSIADCERALKLNPYHFGAFAGMGQCYMKLKRPRAALKAFRSALMINPGLDGVEETIHSIEDALGEEGRKDDKK